MSKNFELLQQIRKEGELYDTSGDGTSPDATGSTETSPPVNEEARQKVLQNSSLPDVFEIS
jgi:hypothetical protein